MQHLSSRNRYWWLIPSSLLAGFLWHAWPHTYAVRLVSPDFILLACLYWAIQRPHNMTPPMGFVIGLFQDTVYGAPLGQHALSMVITLHLACLASHRIRTLVVWQQSAFIGLAAAVYLVVGNWIHLLITQGSQNEQWLLSAALTGLCWTPYYFLFKTLEQVTLLKKA
jgi:rod shape-determining protein MreD